MTRRRQRDSTPTYEGRRLPRPADEVVDQGLAFDVDTLFSRRRMLAAFGLGAATVGLAACGGSSNSNSATSSATTPASSTTSTASSTALTEIPDETAGPYPGDGSNGPDVLEQSGIVRTDIRSSFGEFSGTAELSETGPDVGADDAALFEDVGSVGPVPGIWACGLVRNFGQRRR